VHDYTGIFSDSKGHTYSKSKAGITELFGIMRVTTGLKPGKIVKLNPSLSLKFFRDN